MVSPGPFQRRTPASSRVVSASRVQVPSKAYPSGPSSAGSASTVRWPSLRPGALIVNGGAAFVRSRARSATGLPAAFLPAPAPRRAASGSDRRRGRRARDASILVHAPLCHRGTPRRSPSISSGPRSAQAHWSIVAVQAVWSSPRPPTPSADPPVCPAAGSAFITVTVMVRRSLVSSRWPMRAGRPCTGHHLGVVGVRVLGVLVVGRRLERQQPDDRPMRTASSGCPCATNMSAAVDVVARCR